MDNPLDTYNNKSDTKSFWARPEGKVGMIALGGIGVATIFALPGIAWFTGMLAKIAGNLLLTGLAATGLFVLIYVLTNPRFQTLMKYMFKATMWHATNVFVSLDPVAILKGYTEDLMDHVKNIDKQLIKLQGQIIVLKEVIFKNEKNADRSLGRAQAALKQGAKGTVRVEGRQADRLTLENKDLQTWLTKLEKMTGVLQRIREFAELRRIDIEYEVDSAIRKRELGKSVGSAIRSAMAILSGGEGKELYDAAMERIEQEYSQEMGTLVQFLNSTGDLLQGMDIEDEAVYQKTIGMIDELEAQSMKMIETPKPSHEGLIIDIKPNSSFATIARDKIK